MTEPTLFAVLILPQTYLSFALATTSAHSGLASMAVVRAVPNSRRAEFERAARAAGAEGTGYGPEPTPRLVTLLECSSVPFALTEPPSPACYLLATVPLPCPVVRSFSCLPPSGRVETDAEGVHNRMGSERQPARCAMRSNDAGRSRSAF